MNSKNQLIKKKTAYRGKFMSVVIQPNIDSKFWIETRTDNEIQDALMESGFPIWTEIASALKHATADALSGKCHTPLRWAFGTEMSEKTHIPHYQVFLEFEVLIKRMTLFKSLNERFGDRAHIATKTVYNDNYKNYCVKDSSNFEFESAYYWNIKIDSKGSHFKVNKLLTLRPKLKMISNNLLTGQKLLNKIALGQPDDRTGIWLADVIGGTGKTAFFQTIVDDEKSQGLYLRISDGLERLSSKLRKKINLRLEEGRGYPRYIWINFGRTVTEDSLRIFADFGEQILDGMLDDNFGNTSDGDFMALPYVNLIITANTPPNLKQLTGDRLKLLTLFPIYDALNNSKLIDSLLIPIFVEIKVRIVRSFPNVLEYKYVIRLQSDNYCKYSFGDFEWYEELLSNIQAYKDFISSDRYSAQRYQSKLETEWISSSQYKVQQDVHDVWAKALHYSSTLDPVLDGSKYVEASSFQHMPKTYEYFSDESLGSNIDFNKSDPEENIPHHTKELNKMIPR